MNPIPISTDTPGIFRCPECGLQNPHPIKKPFIHQCGSYTPPEPRDPEDIAYILETLCPECRHYHWPDHTCHCGKCKRKTPILWLIEHGNCSAYQW